MSLKLTRPKHLKLAPEFADSTIEELEALMTPREITFCRAYIQSGGNGSAAVRELWLTYDPVKIERGTKDKQAIKRLQKNATAIASSYIKIKIVQSYLYLVIEKMRKRLHLAAGRSFESWLKQYEDIRDDARANEDFATALRAHVGIGQILGHTGAADAATKALENQTTTALIDQLAEGNKELKQTLLESFGGSGDGVRGERFDDAEDMG